MSETDIVNIRFPIKWKTGERMAELKKTEQTYDELFNELMDTAAKYEILVKEITK